MRRDEPPIAHLLPGDAEGRSAFFALGRHAMYAACQLLRLRPGDEVLSPAFDCDGSLQPFRALGLRVGFVRSNPQTLAVDLEDLRRRIGPQTKLLHLINHFGFPQPWNELLALRQECRIPILEDNAYSLFSTFQGRPFGAFGDLAVFSLRKNLPLLDGGLLRVNNPAYPLTLPPRRSRLFYMTELRGVAALVLNRFGYQRLPESMRRGVRRWRAQDEPPPPLFSDRDDEIPAWPLRDVMSHEFTCDYGRPMSRLARRQLARVTPAAFLQMTAAIRQAYDWLVERLQVLPGITVLWPHPPDGIVPFCVAMLVESGRDEWLETLRSRFSVMAWPTLPAAVLDRLDEFPEVRLLGRKLLQVNVPAERVGAPGYQSELEALVRELSELAHRTAARQAPAPVAAAT